MVLPLSYGATLDRARSAASKVALGCRVASRSRELRRPSAGRRRRGVRHIAVEQFLRDLTERVLPGGRIEVQDLDDVKSVLAPARRVRRVIPQHVLREHVERMMSPADQHGAGALLRVFREVVLLAG